MKNFNKIILLIILISFSVLIVGCNNSKKENNNSNNENVNNTQGEKENEVVTSTMTPEKPNDDKVDGGEVGAGNKTDDEIQPVINQELPIYTINVDSGDAVSITTLVSSKDVITPELIVSKVVEAMEDISLIIGIHSVETQDDIVIVNFESDKAPVNNIGSGMEGSILDAIAQSLIENLNDYNKVIFRIENKAYQTGHIELGYDEIYLSK